MKRIAFLQALVLFVLLMAAWVLFFNRLREQAGPEAEEAPPADIAAAEPLAPQLDKLPIPAAAPGVPSEAGIPAGWRDWIGYLEEQSTAADMARALAELRPGLFGLPPEQAVARIMELLNSGYDRETGLQFRVGRSGELAATGTLRSTLLDWLALRDPAAAGSLARALLGSRGTDMLADEYVVHMRNFARADSTGEPEQRTFLLECLEQMLAKEDWTMDPPPAVAEALDIAVYLEASELVPKLANLTTPGHAQPMRHASALALERLFDQQPLRTARLLISTDEGKAMTPAARAGFLARLDPVDGERATLLRDYLAAPSTSRGEAEYFLQSFPNLNQSLSHNLLSPEIPATVSARYQDRLRRAMQTARDWREAPELAGLADTLAATEARIQLQLTGKPVP